ncbi:MAG: type IV-A pilus assembly ATPase PilB [Candidatus Wallbacteria bacterium]|nr:type IV-A pilus assembly ATPase PilB [Candidatus Wallbacteria bacterium]
MANGSSTRLGELLVKHNLITKDQLTKALAQQETSGGRIGANLVKLGFISEDEITAFLSRQYGVPSINLNQFEVDANVTKLIDADMAQKYQVLPINRAGGVLTVAMADPSNIFAIDDIKFKTGLRVEPVVAAESAIRNAINKYYDNAGMVDELLTKTVEDVDTVAEGEDQVNLAELAQATEDAPVVKLVNLILTDAIKKGASDIHVEPYEKSYRVRYRIDGVLYDVMQPPMKLKAAITSRIKIMSQMDIAERRLPQDGRIKIKVNNRAIDLRVSTLPTVWGEKIVMRILDQTGLRVNLEDLGFEPSTFERFKKGIAVPYGIILVTGPTGSGKTTTLYSALSTLNEPKVNIMTAEDPVEYQLTGINQVQCRPDIGLTFAAALRSFLRQDPDIIMVGEIRDRETAEIAIKASMTGHLVLSTLHTNDAPSTIARLIDMGIEGFMVTSSVVLVQAQRLVRTICKDCKMEYRPKKEMIDGFGITADLLRRLDLPHIDEKNIKFYKGKGCESCGNDGYRGRMGIYEVMEMTENMRQCILKGGSTTDMSRLARTEGMLTLRESAVRKALLGMTTVEEVVRVTAADR